MRGFFGAFGEGSVVMAPFQCDYGYNIRVGRNFFGNPCRVIRAIEAEADRG